MRRAVSLAVVCSLVAVVLGQEPRAPYTPEQLSLVRHISECKISPDGKTVAFVTDITGVQELWTVPAAGGWPTQLTNLNEQVEDLQWSPDNKWLVFASDYGGNERYDLFRVPAAGGAVEKLTDTPLSESEPRFSPDGKRLAFIADPDESFRFDLHVMELGSRKVKRLTKEPVNVLKPVWSRDSKFLAVTRSGDEQKGDLLLVDSETGAKVVVESPVKHGILWTETFSPYGTLLLLRARNRLGFDQLALLDMAPFDQPGPLPKSLKPPTFIGPSKGDVTEALFTTEGIVFLRNEGAATNLYLLPSLRDDYRTRLLPPEGVISHISLDESESRLSLLFEDMNRAGDVWVLSGWRGIRKLEDTRVVPPKAQNGKTVLDWRFDRRPPSYQVTFSLLAGVKSENLSSGQMVSYESFDKTKIHTLFIKPKVNRLGSPAPAIVFAHGGPNGQTMMSFRPLFQILAEAGFAVIAPNFRGSTGYGKAFEDLNNKDWGGGDLKDLVAAVEHFGKRGDIDPKRVGIMGGSYGGYLTLMALSRTPDVWKAGVELYGMPDLVMDYLIAKSRFADWYETEMGNPKKDAALFRERSPLMYLDDIKAPLLIFQGANDTNVPKAESDMLVALLKELKKPHEYVVYPDEGHGFTRRKNLLDFSKRTTAFLVRHLKKS